MELEALHSVVCQSFCQVHGRRNRSGRPGGCQTNNLTKKNFCVHIISTSVLWHCWLGGRKGIRPVKTERWGAGVVICLERGANLHMAQLMPLPLTVSCFSKIKIGFAFLVPAHPGSPRQRAVKRMCVCVCLLLQNVIPVALLYSTLWTSVRTV